MRTATTEVHVNADRFRRVQIVCFPTDIKLIDRFERDGIESLVFEFRAKDDAEKDDIARKISVAISDAVLAAHTAA